MLDRDEGAKTVPVRKDTWKRSFPHLEALIDRVGEQGRYDRFELIKLSRWSAGRIAIIGDAAHALPPNIGQGGGCAMMNALSLAVHLDRAPDVPAALAAWERQERPITDHTQRISVLLGLPTIWPPPLRAFALALAGRSKWLTRQRTRTALHRPTGPTVTRGQIGGFFFFFFPPPRDGDGVHRGVAIDEVDPLPGDPQAVLGSH